MRNFKENNKAPNGVINDVNVVNNNTVANNTNIHPYSTGKLNLENSLEISVNHFINF